MSKSRGNVIAPQDVVESHGADVLRLWVVGSDYAEDLRIGSAILKQHADIYRRLRNTLRFLLGNLAGFDERERHRARGDAGARALGPAPPGRGRPLLAPGLRCLRVPRAVRRAARLLRRRALRLLFRHPQGQPLLRPRGQRPPAGGADGARHPVRLPHRLARAVHLLHRRGGVARPPSRRRTPASTSGCFRRFPKAGATRLWPSASPWSAGCAGSSPARWRSSGRREGSAPACRRARSSTPTPSTATPCAASTLPSCASPPRRRWPRGRRRTRPSALPTFPGSPSSSARRTGRSASAAGRCCPRSASDADHPEVCGRCADAVAHHRAAAE